MKNRQCPECHKLGRDRVSDHLFLMRDGKTWCCLKPYHSPYYERDGETYQPEEREFDLDLEVIHSFSSSALLERRLNKQSLEKLGIKVSYSEETREIDSHYYPIHKDGVIVGYQVRKLPKTFYVVGDCKGQVELLGQSVFKAGGKAAIITGGALDGASAYQIVAQRYPSMDMAFLAPPRGENIGDIKANHKYLSSFQTIYVATDMDKPGRDVAYKIASLFGPKAKIVELPCKDVSDCLVQGKSNEFITALFSAKVYRPSGIISVSTISDDAVIKPIEWGLTYPYEQLNKLTFGMRTKQIIGIGGAPGCGKTSLIDDIKKTLIYKHKQPIGVFELEETPADSLRKLVGSVMNKRIHLPDCVYDLEEARAIKNELSPHLFFYDSDEYTDWKDIEEALRYLAADGIKYFFIDPLSALVAHLNPSDANTYLNTAMFSMSKLRKNLDITIFHVNHLNNPTGGKDHGAGGKVYGSQFSGSRAQWKYSTAMWGMVRDQLAEDEEERNTTELTIIKDRMGGHTGSFKLYYNKTKGILEERDYGF